MNKYLLILFFIPLITGCDNSNINNNNPFLPNYSFTFDINLNLPQNSNLQFASNFVIRPEFGVRGVIVFNTGSGYVAFDAACPNQSLSSCSTMTVNGINAICPCDNAQYNLFSGFSPGLLYPMKQYRVQVSGNIITVFN